MNTESTPSDPMAALEDESQQIRIRVMMTADAAQALGGKLYILGGGFDQIHLPALPHSYRFDLAMIIEVPWTATNQPYQIVVELLDSDGTPVGYRAEATLETGRPPGTRYGTSFTVPLALPVLAEFKQGGRFVLRGLVNGQERNRIAVEAIAPPDGHHTPG